MVREGRLVVRDRGYSFVVAAAGLAVLVTGILAFAPLSASVTATAVPEDGAEAEPSGSTMEVTRESLPESQGWAVVARIAVPLLLVAGAPLLVPSGRRAWLVRGVSAGLLFGGTVMGILSIGVLFLPSAMLMAIGAVKSGGSRITRGSATTDS